MDYHRSGALRSLIPDEESPVRTMDEIVANISPPVSSREIKPGDNLSLIAAQHGTTVRELMRLNPNIKNPNMIKAGEELHVPGNPQARSLATDPYAGMQADIDAALSPSRPGIEEGMLEGSYPEQLLPLMKPLGLLGAAGVSKGMGALAGAGGRRAVNPNMVKEMLAKVQQPLGKGGTMPEGADIGRFFNRGRMPPGPNQALGQGARMPTLGPGNAPVGPGPQMPPGASVGRFANRGSMPPGPNQGLGQGARMPQMGPGAGAPPQNASLLDALRQGSQKMSAGGNERILQEMIQKTGGQPSLAGLHVAGRGQLQGDGGMLPFQELLRRVGYGR